MTFEAAMIVPLHFKGRAHFSEAPIAIQHAFDERHVSSRLRWPIPGQPLFF